MPPGVPADRVAAMRKAFADTFKDPEFLAEAEKRGLGVNAPRDGKALQEVIERVYKRTPPAQIERLRKTAVRHNANNRSEADDQVARRAALHDSGEGPRPLGKILQGNFRHSAHPAQRPHGVHACGNDNFVLTYSEKPIDPNPENQHDIHSAFRVTPEEYDRAKKFLAEKGIPIVKEEDRRRARSRAAAPISTIPTAT